MMDDELWRHAVDESRRLVSGPGPMCKICAKPTELFDVLDFAKTCNANVYLDGLRGIPVFYHRCMSCGFIFTSFFDNFNPTQWMGLLYNAEYYARVDPDYAVVRPRGNAMVIDGLLCGRKAEVIGLDYGGGNGQTATLLRNMGYRYDTHDPFGLSALTPDLAGRYNFCSAFEVAEHTPDPLGFVGDMVRMCSKDKMAILIGTHTHNGNVSDASRLGWWYAAPRNGHISLYSKQSLLKLAGQFGLHCISFSESTHLLTRGMSSYDAYRFLLKGKLRSRLRRLFRLDRIQLPTTPQSAVPK